jgi:serine protease Do
VLKKSLLFSTLLLSSVYANTIKLNLVDQKPIRKNITTTKQILSFNSSINKAVHSVVNISTKLKRKNIKKGMQKILNDPFFKQFFGKGLGNTIPKNRLLKSLGSGVILSKDGYIVTNAHMVVNAQEIVVTIADQEKEYNAVLIGADKDSDIAVIKIDEKNLQPISIGSSNHLLVGDVVFAIGNPFGIGQTVTQGIISALNKNKIGLNRYENFIQTDASINPGNSGGALIDSRGALIGINSAIMTRSGGNNGIGLAIPVDMVKDIVQTLVKEGKVTRGYLGVTVEDITKELKSVYNHKKGGLVLDVAKDTPASQSGIRRGDLIYAVNGKVVDDSANMQRIIGTFKPNDKITFSIERDKKDITIDIVLASRDIVNSIDTNRSVLSGLYVNNIDIDNSKKYKVPMDIKGVLILDVEAASKAEKVGFQAGDIIIQVENIQIEDLTTLSKAIKQYKKQPKRVYVDRYGRTLAFVIK